MIRSQDYDMYCQLHEYCTKQSIFSYVEQTGRATEENTYPNIYYAGLSN